MIDWLKGAGKALLGAAAAFLLVMAGISAARNRARARQLQDKAEGEAEIGLDGANRRVAEALEKAKIHSAKADAATERAHKHLSTVGNTDENVGAIVDRWRADSLREHSDDEPLGIG